ncbi:hypothetical protein CARUB_v10007106mg [Capsella rubella]|uniref:KIB1-4 beta-propeller domain-containing protein n=1 Tax=Capsella rubella TaxID=81985 RepID=R0H4W8_9BRAS|nr:probable F-box protein At4g22060 [Capsella rubella]EOA18548.1 hypothetical protein CARUB_v10007106mg [Capsella rubella]
MNAPSPMSNGSGWSKLSLNLLNKVFKCLGFAELAESACPSLPNASRKSSPNSQTPWLILFPEKGKDYCLLFNPQDKEKLQRIQDLGDNFANSHCLAICGSWLFMRDLRYNLYIMNLLTREKIDLPSVESQFGRIKIERTIDDMFHIKLDGEYFGDPDNHIDIYYPSLWIDENTKDYVVTWYLRYSRQYLVYSRKGDNLWKHASLWSHDMLIYDMVHKDNKIYLYSDSRDVKVLDFSRDVPRKIFKTKVNYDVWAKGLPRRLEPGDVWDMKKEHLVVTLTGEPLRVRSIIRSDSDVWYFRIYKMNSSNTEWEKLTCLGDEAIILDQRITVLASATEGIKRNSIYFSGYRSDHQRDWSEKDIFIFNLDTNEVQRPHLPVCSSIRSSNARWFLSNSKEVHN